MFTEKKEKAPDAFWKEFEENTGEKVLKRGLGKYISGWDRFDESKRSKIWGLIIFTSGGFRFRHFPQYSLFDAFIKRAENDQAEEKSIYIQNEKIISSGIVKESNWFKRLSGGMPKFIISFKDETGAEKKLIFETDYGFDKDWK